MTLDEWRRQRKLSHGDVAKLINAHNAAQANGAVVNLISNRTVQKWCAHTRVPRDENLAAIYSITNGEVDANSFYSFIRSDNNAA